MKTISFIIALLKVKPVVFDGFLCCTLAMSVEFENYLSKEESYKYMNASWRFYILLGIAVYAAGVSSLIFFRSKSYSDHRKEQDVKKALAEGNSTVTTQITETKTNETQTNPPPVGTLVN